MGKTPKPLTILCDPDIAEWPEIVKLREQNHKIVVPYDLTIAAVKWDDIDLIFAGKAWRMNAQLRPYVDLAIKEGRRVRYPKAKGDE